MTQIVTATTDSISAPAPTTSGFTNILRTVDNATVLLDSTQSKNVHNRLLHFVRWLDDTGTSWIHPDLEAYALHMQSDERTITTAADDVVSSPLSPASAKAHLSTIRGRYKKLLVKLPDMFGQLADHVYSNGLSPADRRAIIQDVTDSITRHINPVLTADVVSVTKVQDKADGTRLNRSQIEALIAAPGIRTPRGLRDTAIFALMLSTGVREDELCKVQVSDLRTMSNGELCLQVTGKGNKQRLIPYGELSAALVYVDTWCRVAGIHEGYVFRGFKERHTPNKPLDDVKGVLSERIRTTRLKPRQLQNIIAGYPVLMDGNYATIQPHDLRRSYACRLYAAGVDIIAIRDNLGHVDIKTTQGYIGSMDMSERRAPALFHFPHTTADLQRI